MNLLRQSTSVLVKVGPCVDATDGFTLETAIAWATTEANVFKQDSAAATDIGANTWSLHLAGGYYNVTLTASNTDTLGNLVLEAHDSAMRPVRREFTVVPANVYDALVLGTDNLKTEVIEISGSVTAADNLEAGTLGLVTGTVSTSSTTTLITTNLAETTNDHYNGRTITFTSGLLTGQSQAILDYSGTTRNLTVAALTEAPSNGDTFIIS